MMRRRSAKDKELADSARLLRNWRAWHRDRLKEVLAGPHAVIATQVVEFLKNMSPASASALLELMRGQVWADVDADTRFELLHLINRKIMQMREQNGMEPISDPLPGQQDNVFRIIKAMFESFPTSAGKHTEVSSVNRGVLSHE